MNKKPKISMVTIPIREAKSIGANPDAGLVLLYDETEGCYFKATISYILNYVMRRVDSFQSELLTRQEAFEKKVVEQQRSFIKDAADINETIIKLVKNGGNPQ